jgi:hypothetical protein
MFGVSDNSIRQWARNKKIERVSHGSYDLKQAFEFGLKRDVFEDSTSMNELTEEEVQANKALLEKSRADLAETEVAIEKRNLIDSRELGGYLVNEMVIFKRELLSLSRTLPSSCYGLTKEEIVDQLEERLQRVYDERMDASEIDAFLDATEEVK